jgi:hypothetical protein
MKTSQTLLRLGVLILVALPVVQCQTGPSTSPTGANKTTDAATTPATAAEKKTAEAAAKKAAVEAANKKTAEETAKKAADAAKATVVVKLENARVDALDSNYESISLRDCGNSGVCIANKSDSAGGQVYHPKVNDQALRAQLKQYHVGDHLRVNIDPSANELKDIRGPWAATSARGTEGDAPPETPPTTRLLVLSACAFAILAIAALATRGSPQKFIVGMDNRYSNSKFQIALWFWVMLSTYLATVVFRLWYAGGDFLGGVSIPQNLLVLSGLSVITYGGAKAITTSKVNASTNPAPVAVAVTPAANVPVVAVAMAVPADPAIGVVVHAPPTAPPAAVAVTPPANPNPKNAQPVNGENIITDLVQNDFGGFDFGDFQMIAVTIVAVVMYSMLIYHFLGSIQFLKTITLPDVDSTILAGFGLGQGAYLAKKAGGNVGTS